VDGINYPPLFTPDTTFYTPGRWRIEVKPTPITDTLVYLHTIAIGDSSNVPVAGGIALQNNFSAGTDWNDTLYFFSADADAGKFYHIFTNVNGNRTVGIFATDLFVGSYLVKMDGIVMATVSTDTNGIIQSSLTMTSGNHTIEIDPNTTSITEINKDNPLQVYPNPAHTELNIELYSNLQKCDIEIYNSTGQLMMKKTNKKKINISLLTAGVYVVKVKLDDEYFTTKFIKE
jgi:hypothetical protein